MRILVKKGGPLTTLQDLGRYGYQKFGVLVSGAMDDVSLRLSNLLVQNDPGEGALEMTMSGACSGTAGRAGFCPDRCRYESDLGR